MYLWKRGNKKLVFDAPIRIFHWLFALFFILAFLIAKTIEDDSPIFPYHMILGLTLSFLVILRIIWGFCGSKYSKFTGFDFHLGRLVQYMVGILTGAKKKWAGHNPATSWAAVIMFLLALGLGTTGYLMTAGTNKEDFEDIHELLANAFALVVLLHVLGVAVHWVRHRDAIGLSMVDGKKDMEEVEAIPNSRRAFGVLLIIFVLSFLVNLVSNYDSRKTSLNFFGMHLNFGKISEE